MTGQGRKDNNPIDTARKKRRKKRRTEVRKEGRNPGSNTTNQVTGKEGKKKGRGKTMKAFPLTGKEEETKPPLTRQGRKDNNPTDKERKERDSYGRAGIA